MTTTQACLPQEKEKVRSIQMMIMMNHPPFNQNHNLMLSVDQLTRSSSTSGKSIWQQVVLEALVM